MPMYLVHRIGWKRKELAIVRTQRIFAPRAAEALDRAGPNRAAERFADVCRENEEVLITPSCGRRKTTVPSKAS